MTGKKQPKTPLMTVKIWPVSKYEYNKWVAKLTLAAGMAGKQFHSKWIPGKVK